MGRSVGRSRMRKSLLKHKRNGKKTTKQNGFKGFKVKSTKPPTKKKPKTIADLSDHCLIKIFDGLNLSDLVNVSVTSTRFSVSTCIIFGRKFAKNGITVSNEVLPGMLKPTSVLLLKSFGHLAEKLTVIYKEDYNRFNHSLEQAIIQYSTMYATEIKFVKADKFAFVQIKRPMAKVTKVVFNCCVVGPFIVEFNKWFPNAQSLELLDSTILSETDVTCIEQKFPQLQHLAIVNPKQTSEDALPVIINEDRLLLQPVFSNDNLKSALDLNPQLTSLKLRQNNVVPENLQRCSIQITTDLLEYINKSLTNLKELDLFIALNEQLRLLQHTSPQVVHFKNLRKIRFVVDYAEVLLNYAITTGQPARLIITASEELSGSCATFMNHNKMWSEIEFNGDWESYQCFENLKIHLPESPILNSIKISVNGHEMYGKQNQVLSLLNDCRHLQKFKVGFSIVRWKNIVQAIDYDLNSYDKRREELRFFESIKLLRHCYPPLAERMDDDDDDYWLQYFVAIQHNDDVNWDDLPVELDKHGISTLETYRKAFESKCLNLWQSAYQREGNYFYATFVNEQ